MIILPVYLKRLLPIIIFNNNQEAMQDSKKENKSKYTYITEAALMNDTEMKECLPCSNCQSWQQKTQELIWGYEELLSIKQKEIETLTSTVAQLDQKLKKITSKNDSLLKKVQAYEQQIDRMKGNNGSSDNVISYYKEREAQLLSQLKIVENELFNKNVQIKDELDCKEDKVLSEILVNNNTQSRRNLAITKKSQPALIPIIHTSETLGKMLQRNLCDLEKMSQQKMMLEVKHRMAVLRAAQLSVLK